MLILVLLMLAQKGLAVFVPSGCVRIRGPYKMHQKGFAVLSKQMVSALFKARRLSLMMEDDIGGRDSGDPH